MTELKKTIVLAAGGTGGHVFPAQALAQELSSQGDNVLFFTDSRGHQFKGNGASISIPAAQLTGSLGKKVQGSFQLMAGVAVAFRHLRRLKPAAVVGFGGYASFPTVMAAISLRIPTIIHQADAYFGRANCLLAPLVTRIATSFPHVENIPKSCRSKITYTGLPVRPEIQPAPYVLPKEKGPFHLLVTGGSQGAKVFGEVIPQAVALLEPALQKRLHISQQCRPEFLGLTQTLYKNTQAHVELAPFLDAMGERYKAAHLVIARAGASSVTEAALVGRPALFIPYPYAMDDHQFHNAQQVVESRGGWILREKDFTPAAFALYLSDVMKSPWKLEEAESNIRRLALPDACLKLANLVKLVTM